jgi:hypothetical protein
MCCRLVQAPAADGGVVHDQKPGGDVVDVLVGRPDSRDE